VGQEYSKADKGKTFRKGGIMDKKGMHSEKSEMKMDKGQDKAMIKKAFKQHDLQEHKGGKGTSLKLKKGGMSAGCGYDKGGKVKKFAAGGKVKGYLGGGMLRDMVDSGALNATGSAGSTRVQPFIDPARPGASPTGGGAQGGLDQVNQGSSQIGKSLGTIGAALGTGGGQGPASPLMPYGGAAQTGFKKGGRVKKMAMGGAPMMPPQAPVDPRMAMMAKKKAPRGVAPKPTGMMPPRPPMAAPQVAPTAPMKKGGMAKCATGGMTKGESPIQRQAKGGAKVIKMAKGGSTSSRGDGCAIRGKTRA
jgi:hypothetical protein